MQVRHHYQQLGIIHLLLDDTSGAHLTVHLLLFTAAAVDKFMAEKGGIQVSADVEVKGGIFDVTDYLSGKLPGPGSASSKGLAAV